MIPSHLPDLPALRFRAEALRNIREFFHRSGVLEVETPVLSRGISLDCHIDVFSSRFHSLGYPRGSEGGGDREGETYYLQTSPEPHMKRLLCLGFPDLYQLGKAFRNGEKGDFHNPEFTMLEWYRRGFSLMDLMEEVEKVCLIVTGIMPSVRLTYRDAFGDRLGVDPLEMSREDLLALPELVGRAPSPDAFPTKADALDFIMSHVIEPGFPKDRFTFVHDFPAEQAAQAQVHESDPRVAHRFEVYGGGMELGNGYLELADPVEYERRFNGENAKRRAAGKPELPQDPALLGDLRRGLPACAGVAMGVDRLVQLALGRENIRSVLAFPWDVC
ncbi:MAG: elongation factor P--(R)-beta-lysine ligase [Fibrobacteres bacterium]|nr:elongation factor P--(R)-beta-lysine ligase [Fibrobacterota bacterium]